MFFFCLVCEMKCIVCCLRIISCSYHTNCCISFCLWFLCLLFLILLSSATMYSIIYILLIVGLICQTCCLHFLNCINDLCTDVDFCACIQCVYGNMYHMYIRCYIICKRKRTNVLPITRENIQPEMVIIESCGEPKLSLGIALSATTSSAANC